MLKDITLGQYFPGDSYIHRLDPRTKLLMVVVYIVALFLATGWLGYGLVIAFLGMCIKISGIPLKSITRGLKPVMMIVAFTGILNLFFTQGTHEIFTVFGFTLTWEAVERAAQMILRIICAARSTASQVREKPKMLTISWVPGVKNRFSTPVKTTITSTGFRPRVMAFRGIMEILMQAARNRATRP